VLVLLAVQYLDFLLLAGVAEADAQHEAIQLSLRQRKGTLILDGILRRQHHEWGLQRVGATIDGDLALFHRLQQRRLGFGRGAIDLVDEDDLGVNRARAKLKFARLLVKDGHPGHVAWQHIRRKLDTLELTAD